MLCQPAIYNLESRIFSAPILQSVTVPINPLNKELYNKDLL